MTTRTSSTIAAATQTLYGLVLLAIGFMATLGTVLGFLGSFWWVFDLLSAFRLQYAIVLVVVGILYGLTLGRATSLIFLVAAAANIATIVPFYLEEPADAASDGGELHLTSFNVAASNVRRAETLQWITDNESDIGFILESSSDWDPALRALDPDYRVIASVPGDRTFGITAIARGDAVAQIVRLGDAREPVVRVETALGGEPVVVYAVHPMSPTSEVRARLRDETLAALTDAVRRETAPVVVIGDLNATPWSSTFRALAKEARLIDSMRGNGLQPSWPNASFVLSIPIDHALHTDELTTSSRGLGPDLGSDHRPIDVVFAFAEER